MLYCLDVLPSSDTTINILLPREHRSDSEVRGVRPTILNVPTVRRLHESDICTALVLPQIKPPRYSIRDVSIRSDLEDGE